MRKYRILALMFSLMLVAAACSESTGSTATAAAVDTTAAIEDAAHETGEEADHDESEAAHEEEEAHEEDDAHDDAEEAHEEDAHDDMDMDMDMSGAMSADNIPAADGDVTSEYTIILSEFGFDPTELDLTPGETVRFILINEGVVLHEFRLTTEHKAEEHLASGHEDHGDDGDESEEGHHEDADILVNVAGGETRTVEMTLPTDADALDQVACLIPGHYEAGMFASIDF